MCIIGRGGNRGCGEEEGGWRRGEGGGGTRRAHVTMIFITASILSFVNPAERRGGGRGRGEGEGEGEGEGLEWTPRGGGK